MVNQETDKGKRAAFSARMSVETIVVTLVASAAVGILTAQILAGGWEDSGSPLRSKVVGLRHEAMTMAAPSDASQVLPTFSEGTAGLANYRIYPAPVSPTFSTFRSGLEERRVWKGQSSTTSGRVSDGDRATSPTSSQNDYTTTDVAADQDKSSLPNVQHLSRADLEAREVSGGGRTPTNDTIVRNGITIVSPPLLVPVISADAIQTPNGSEAPKAPSARKRSHYTNRAHRRGQRRVVRSAPFWRIVAK